jgi:protein involved in polysaccharide export with SLBB domain
LALLLSLATLNTTLISPVIAAQTVAAEVGPAEKPANLTEQDAGKALPVSFFKGRVTNQSSRYILGPGDTVAIKIKDLEKFDQQFSVRPDGYVTVHPFGEFYVAGTDVQGLQQWLEEQFKYYLLKPQITVDVKEMRPAQIYVSGAVKRPGAYQFLRAKMTAVPTASNPTQDEAQTTVSNVLAKAGGVSLKADITNIEVVHTATGQKEIFNLRDLLEGKLAHDLWLLPEDMVTVPVMDHPMDPETFRLISNSTFFRDKFPVVVLGAVQQQGEVQVDPTNNSLNAAIALAGGFVPRLSKRDKIIVQRPGNNGSFNRWMIDREKSNLELQPGDVLYVADSKTASMQRGVEFLNQIVQTYYFGINGANVIKNGLFNVK